MERKTATKIEFEPKCVQITTKEHNRLQKITELL